MHLKVGGQNEGEKVSTDVQVYPSKERDDLSRCEKAAGPDGPVR